MDRAQDFITLYAFVDKRYATRPIGALPAFPYEAKFVELRQNSNGMCRERTIDTLNEERMKELCQKMNEFLLAMFRVDGLFNIYKVRQFFEFRNANLFPEYVRKSIRPNEESHFPESLESSPEAMMPGKLSFVSDYFPNTNNN